jgi:hypothetical protein
LFPSLPFSYNLLYLHKKEGNPMCISPGTVACLLLLLGAQGGDGLKGEYWSKTGHDVADPFAGKPTLTRTDSTVDFNWGTQRPDPSITPDRFVVRWSGFVEPLHSEVYTFYTMTDDGARLRVNGELVVDDWKPHSLLESSGKIKLVAGKRYPIVMEYFDTAVKAEAHLLWSSDSTPKQVIPKERLYPATSLAPAERLAVPAAPEIEAAQKAPVPSAEEQREAQKLIREIFAEEYRQKAPDELSAFARKLVKQGLETRNDPVGRYVLLHEAMEFATKAADVAAAFVAADKIGDLYENAGATAMKEDVLSKVRSSMRTTEQKKKYAEYSYQLACEALQANDFATAKTCARTAETYARGRDKELQERAKDLGRQIPIYEREHGAAEKALLALSANPDDPASNETYGTYLCFIKGSWKEGLPFLAKSGDKQLEEVAKLEKSASEERDAGVRCDLAELYYTIAEESKSNPLKEQNALARCLGWYKAALKGNLQGLSKIRAEMRIKEIEKKTIKLTAAVEVKTAAGRLKVGLLHYWSFDNAEVTKKGGTAKDATGNGLDLVVSGEGDKDARDKQLQIVDGIKGKAVRLLERNWRSGHFVTSRGAPGIGKLNSMEQLTLCVWVKPDQLDDGDGRRPAGGILGRSLHAAQPFGICLFKLRPMSYVGERSKELSVTGKTQLKVGEWTHIALVFDGKAPGAERHRLYVNGVLEGSKAHPRSTTPESGPGLTFGMVHGAGGWVGLMDEVFLYNRPLSPAELAALMRLAGRAPSRMLR